MFPKKCCFSFGVLPPGPTRSPQGMPSDGRSHRRTVSLPVLHRRARHSSAVKSLRGDGATTPPWAKCVEVGDRKIEACFGQKNQAFAVEKPWNNTPFLPFDGILGPPTWHRNSATDPFTVKHGQHGQHGSICHQNSKIVYHLMSDDWVLMKYRNHLMSDLFTILHSAGIGSDHPDFPELSMPRLGKGCFLFAKAESLVWKLPEISWNKDFTSKDPQSAYKQILTSMSLESPRPIFQKYPSTQSSIPKFYFFNTFSRLNKMTAWKPFKLSPWPCATKISDQNSARRSLGHWKPNFKNATKP